LSEYDAQKTHSFKCWEIFYVFFLRRDNVPCKATMMKSIEHKKFEPRAHGQPGFQPLRAQAFGHIKPASLVARVLAIAITGLFLVKLNTWAIASKAEPGTGIIEMPDISDEFMDAIPVAIDFEDNEATQDVLLDFGSMPSGRLFKQRDQSEKDGAPRASDRMIIVTPALMAFRDYAIPELERYLITMTNDVHARTVLGVRLFQENRLDESLNALRSALTINPLETRTAELHSGILMQQNLDPLPAAIPEEIHRLLDAHPGNNVIRFNLACALARSGQAESALGQLDVLARSGWQELVYHITDRDFSGLRDRADFAAFQDALLSEYRENLIRYLLGSIRPETLAP
jgi:tetratricopeptide (TPR) repeat protein